MTLATARDMFVWQDYQARTRPLAARNGDVYLVAHHAVAYTVQQIHGTFSDPNREVNAQFAIGPEVSGRDAYVAWRTLPDDVRAYTTASDIDDQAITFEMANLDPTRPPYPVGSTGKQIAAQLAADMHREYGMPLDRWHVTCHSEVYQRGWGSYSTACCGDDLRNSLDWIVAEAQAIDSGSSSLGQEEDQVSVVIIFGDKTGQAYPYLYNIGTATRQPIDAGRLSLMRSQAGVVGGEAIPEVTMSQGSFDAIPVLSVSGIVERSTERQGHGDRASD